MTMQPDSSPPEPARRREVVVSGRRVKVVDLHAHCAVPEAMALMGRPAGRTSSLIIERVDERLDAMNAQGIDVEALSINPYWYEAGRDVAASSIGLEQGPGAVVRAVEGA